MARGGARPGAGRPAGKSANTTTVSARARARARDGDENQRPWPADKVERWAIDRLIPYAKNARTHSDAQDRRDSREHQGVGLDAIPPAVDRGIAFRRQAVDASSAATARSRPTSSAVLGRVEPHLMVTDPPYGVEYDPAWRHTARRRQGNCFP